MWLVIRNWLLAIGNEYAYIRYFGTNYNVMKTHKDLDVWKKSIDLVTAIYELTKFFPKEETYGLTNQIRRAAVSI